MASPQIKFSLNLINRSCLCRASPQTKAVALRPFLHPLSSLPMWDCQYVTAIK
uniref:Uncharacterized protein n=1 Tax=Picea glauca TaxID=3330 RepID=A0A117NIB2_PICGL|nr:hypothetical protein ABT39_MTgene2837 [Picea glauca]